MPEAGERGAAAAVKGCEAPAVGRKRQRHSHCRAALERAGSPCQDAGMQDRPALPITRSTLQVAIGLALVFVRGLALTLEPV